ncbi:MAG: DegT/DnrJ/EryC1/StrS family aminotransferase [Ignavibacteriae bacterium]|nr:DegT/DnrJ/EryC1/StrS family aminotransferase [Ignavibacteriota bacterium]
MKIPLVDLQAQHKLIRTELDSAIRSVIDNSQFILGKAVSDFETAFAKAHNVKHCIAVGSGTDALHLALWANGIDSGDEVITVPYTFIATAEAISLLGATPVFVDIEPKTYTMNVTALEKAITPKTKAILPVHLYGQAADMNAIMEIAKKHNLNVIEDAAQAHLATYDGKFVGEFGNAACFSFYPVKNLGAFGEAGAITTNDDVLALNMKQMRDHGQVSKYNHEMIGHNYRMDGIQGAVLGVKLNYLQKWTERRREIASLYRTFLQNVGDIILPFESPNAYHVYHLFVIRTKKRDALQKFLAEHEIATALHYSRGLHEQKAYSFMKYKRGDFPQTESAADECISLPLYAEMTDEQVEIVATKVKEFFNK